MNLVAALAEVCHEVNRSYCESIGDMREKPWLDAPEWQKASATKGVEAMLASNLSA